jgi:hypothetical protein
MATTIQFLRSDIAQTRPEPGVLANGTPMVNTHQSEPGLFFRARDGSLFKVGPTAVGPSAPNSEPSCYPGNSKGEMWLDTSDLSKPILKIYDGAAWVEFQTNQEIFNDIVINNSLTVLGPSYLSSIVDGLGSPGSFGQVLSTNGPELRWQWIRTENVIYVAKNGDDDNDGFSPLTAKLTIKAALSIAQPGFAILVAPGDYYEENPLIVPESVAVEGADLRTTTIYALNDEDLFQVYQGTYIAEFSFRTAVNLAQGRAAVGFPPTGAGVITRSPYVQNCTNFMPNSTGLKVDGFRAQGLRSMVLDSYTQFNPNGIGAHIFNQGYAQLVSMFTICADKAVLVESGGVTSITNSNSDFGNFGLYADGVGPLQFTAEIDGSGQNFSPYTIKNLSTATRPYVGQVVTVGGLYYRVREIQVTSGGVGYTSAPAVTISIGTGPNAIAAQGVAVVRNGEVVEVNVVSSGQNYTLTDAVTVTFNGGGGTGATAAVVKDPIYYTVESATPVVSGNSVISLVENLPYTPDDGDEIRFFPVSQIISSSHCFEFIGSGTDIQSSLPALGGVPIQENEVVQINGGRVAVTSTDHIGNFRVGEGLVINQNTGTISGEAFTKSILAIVTPYILALG